MVSKLNVTLEKESLFYFRQFITINKGLESIAGRCSKSLHSLPRATEYLMFYTLGKICEGEKRSIMATYIYEQIEKAKTTKNSNLLSRKTISRIFKDAEGYDCVSNWVLGYNNPSKEQYKKLQEYVQSVTPNNVFKEEYDDLMFTFNLSLGLTDVWNYSFYNNKISDHPTAKPTKLIKQIIEIATNKGNVVLDPTAGSGSTIQACKDLKRSCIGIEKSDKYSQKIKRQIIDQTELMCFSSENLPNKKESTHL